MLVKQELTMPNFTIFTGGISTIPKWVVYGIVLTTVCYGKSPSLIGSHPYIYTAIGISSSQLLLTPSFFRGVGQPPTSIIYISLNIISITITMENHHFSWEHHLLFLLSQASKSPRSAFFAEDGLGH